MNEKGINVKRNLLTSDREGERERDSESNI